MQYRSRRSACRSSCWQPRWLSSCSGGLIVDSIHPSSTDSSPRCHESEAALLSHHAGTGVAASHFSLPFPLFLYEQGGRSGKKLATAPVSTSIISFNVQMLAMVFASV